MHQLPSFRHQFPGFGTRSVPATSRRRAITLDPGHTRIPGCTAISHSGPNSTSTRDPNLIRPTRSPFGHQVAGLFVNTMRRAIRPAICLKTTQVPSPRTLTTFCSFSAEHSSRLAT
jgi:hypothetical protein